MIQKEKQGELKSQSSPAKQAKKLRKWDVVFQNKQIE
jgi:hypothetical protein